MRRMRLITVCAECLCASCWHREFMCRKGRSAGTVKKTSHELRKLNREHPSNYSAATVERHCGSLEYAEPRP